MISYLFYEITVLSCFIVVSCCFYFIGEWFKDDKIHLCGFTHGIPFSQKRFILQRKYRTVNQALLLFGGTVLFSSIHMLTIHFPPGFKEVSPLSGVLLVLCVACSFFMMEYVNEKNLHQSFFILMYRFTLGYLLVNDLLLLAQMPSVSGMESSTIIYLIGNKFEVTYMHLFFLHYIIRSFALVWKFICDNTLFS